MLFRYPAQQNFRSTPSPLTWWNCLHYISSVVVLLAQACRFDARLSAVSVTSMRNRLKNSWCEREDFVRRRCEMLPHFSLSPSWERSSLFPPRLVRKQRTGRSETTALNTAPPSPWQPALAHPRRAPHGFRFALDPERAPGCLASSRGNFRVRARSGGRGEKGGRVCVHVENASGCSLQTPFWDAADELSGAARQSCY